MSNGIPVLSTAPDPRQIARTQAMADMLRMQSMQPRQIVHPLQGLAQMAQAGAGALLQARANRQEKEREEARQSALMALLGGAPAPAPGTSPVTPPASALPASFTGAPPSVLASVPPPPPAAAPPAGPSATPNLAALVATAGQFPELAPVINPLIAARMTPEKPVALAEGATLVRPSTGEVVARGGAARPKFQTDLGKAVADQRLAVEQFGKDSPQARAFADLVTAERSGGGVDLSDESGLRKEFTRASGDFIQIRDAFGKIQAARPTAQGDLALIFNYMKILDPGSVVREGEFATAQNTAGVPDRVRNTYNRLLSGERLAPDQREGFKTQAADLFTAQRDQQNLLERNFGAIADRSGLRRPNVVVDFQGDLRNFAAGSAPAESSSPAGTPSPTPPTAPAGAAPNIAGAGPPAGGAFTTDELLNMSDEELIRRMRE